MEDVFTKIYETNAWGNNGNAEYSGSSGDGSRIDYNKDTYVPFLKKFITDHNIKTIVDLGCGDFQCGKLIYDDLDVSYTGYDAYKKIIEYNSAQCALPKYTFNHLDFCNNKESIRFGDLCILKDVIQHWSLANIYTFLDYLVEYRKFKYILICNCSYQRQGEVDIPNGLFRTLSCDDMPLKKYNPVKLYNYETKEVSVIVNNLHLLQVYNFDQKIRCGANNDGGYILAELDGGYDGYISAGISNEESFSRDFIKKYNMNEYDCFGFDGTIVHYPYDFTKNIMFIKKNINGFNDDNNTNLSCLMSRYNNLFLKMDVEGGEYPWLLQIDESQLNKFKQIVIEFHGITNDGWGCKYSDKLKCLKKLANTHYIVHAHGNNHGPVVNTIPDVIELTYVNKNYFNSIPALNTTALPILNLDFPNRNDTNDINLNFYPFTN
jgi:hypothetical protein